MQRVFSYTIAGAVALSISAAPVAASEDGPYGPIYGSDLPSGPPPTEPLIVPINQPAG